MPRCWSDGSAMRTVSLTHLQKQVEARRDALGILDTPAEVEALRNKGARRTPEKRALLARIRQRALEAGVEPLKAYF